MGDGGFQMCIEELGTIMEFERPVKMVMLNNHYLGNVRQWQDMFFNSRQSFTKMRNPKYELISEAYKIPYELVYEREQLAPAVKRMLQAPGAYVLECIIKNEDNILPMTPPGCDVDDMMLEIQV